MLHYLLVGLRITITQSHTHTMQQTRAHKAVTRRVEAKKLLSRRRQLEYRDMSKPCGTTMESRLKMSFLLTYRLTVIGRMLGKFTQLKRNNRYVNLCWNLVGIQGSLFHIAAGSQDSLYRGQIQKLLQCCQDPYQQIPVVITIQKKYSLIYLRRTIS